MEPTAGNHAAGCGAHDGKHCDCRLRGYRDATGELVLPQEPLSPNAPNRERPQKDPNKDDVTYIRELVMYCGLIQQATFGLPYSGELEFLLEQLADAKDDALKAHHAYIDLKYLQTTNSPKETLDHLGWAEEERKCLINYHDFHGRQIPDPLGSSHRYRAGQLRAKEWSK